jgi:hypothetical protein
MLAIVLSYADTCPQCGGPWDVRLDRLGTPASDFASCAFRCHRCRLGFSNAKSPGARVPITATPEQNVPAEARPGLLEALAGAINAHNRPVKAKKFCSGRSEDAVTWTVVCGLRATVAVGALIGRPELGEPEALLLWGHPVEGPSASGVRKALQAVSDALGEHPDRRSEPDVVALWPGLLAFVEAKHGSANDSQPGYATYLPATGLFAAADDQVKAEGSYQLTRNWVIGTRLADKLATEFLLVNLGPVGIADHAAGFAALLEQTPQRRFEHRTWRQALERAETPVWLADYASAEHLLI